MTTDNLYPIAVNLLKKLIKVPSFSKEENETADIIVSFIYNHRIVFDRKGNNVYAKNKFYDSSKPTILLNSHHDTVKPNLGYTMDPFLPLENEGKLYGLGSNDAGGCLVSLIAVFVHFYERNDLKYNLVLAASAEEEISGINGIESLLPLLGNISFAIIGEPTKMEMAIAERGLMVIDCVAEGIAGHAARLTGENSISKAITDIAKINLHQFDRVSELLGETKLTVTVIETPNKQHNVIPDTCNFVIDARVNELYQFEEILSELQQLIVSKIMPRSTRLKSSLIPLNHPLVEAGIKIGKGYYGSPTTSDKALMPFPALKIGPGDSARSHTADEFIYLNEIEDGIHTYIKLLNQLL